VKSSDKHAACSGRLPHCRLTELQDDTELEVLHGGDHAYKGCMYQARSLHDQLADGLHMQPVT